MYVAALTVTNCGNGFVRMAPSGRGMVMRLGAAAGHGLLVSGSTLSFSPLKRGFR